MNTYLTNLQQCLVLVAAPVPLAGPWSGILVFASDPAARVRISSLLSEEVSQGMSMHGVTKAIR